MLRADKQIEASQHESKDVDSISFWCLFSHVVLNWSVAFLFYYRFHVTNMNPNIPMYPMQMGDGYTKYYSQPNHLPYATYNSGESDFEIYWWSKNNI